MQSNLWARQQVKTFLCIILAAAAAQATIAAAAEADAAATDALRAALAKNVDHARKWLDERDYKSLAQSTSSVTLLAELLRAKSDDPAWQTALTGVTTKAADLQAAARSDGDLARCQASLAALDQAVAASEKLKPAGPASSAPKSPAIRPLMLTMDSVQADAKVALLTGNAATAKKQAYVLAELARLVSNSRSTDNWSQLAGDFSKACTAAATSTETDPKAVRQLFRNIAERCEACHEKSRDR